MLLMTALRRHFVRSKETVKSTADATLLVGRLARNAILAAGLLPAAAFAQTTFSWQQIKDKFEVANPTLKAAQLNIDESRAAEITAYLRPNPSVSGLIDQINPFTKQPPPNGGPNAYRPFAYAEPYGTVSYLHEREHKRELRRDQAKESTAIAESSYLDQERGLVFSLRSAFVQVLQSKAFLENAQQNLDYWDHELGIFRVRFQAGDLAQIDLDRLELQRAQFESDYETAIVNLRTAKIELLMLLNDRTPIDRFDVSGPFDFAEALAPLEDFRNLALAARPDLRVAVQNVELARITHQLAVANGSTDPTFTIDVGRNPPIPAYFGVSVSIPLRIFDRNQGEKARTQVDVGRNERLRDAAEAQVFNDVDSAYYTLIQNVNLLKPYRAKYLGLAASVRDRVAFAFKNGGASLLDYLDAEKSYRDTRLAYLNLIGSYLTAAAQMNMAAGREVVQ
jgi:cobalt-zinc-cadmium efflux system outer membrane protein